MRIFVDADGCPVVQVAVNLAKEFNIPITLVKNYAHILNNDYAEIVTVDTTADSADYYIVNHLSQGDIVVTQDNGLAAMCLSRNATPINQNGLIINDSNIITMLSSRHLHKELRSQGIYTSKVKKRNKGSDKEFEISFRRLLQEVTVNGNEQETT
ncbi:YaiI/YqxD family protein [Gudongella sp. DL1XJH-153]|uniref:YaiI/YqxD family protein n=1 Tax=Gudongella sp. DL1XJH-153 TaxID=3409804 RepID=UPI003BB66952